MIEIAAGEDLSGAATTARWVYPFEDGSAEMRELLGNKGANLAEMTRVLGAEKVPGGFTITTAACVEYMRNGGQLPAGLDDQIAGAVGELEHASGKQFGDPDDPLLLSVRSGAPVSMPGMLDTILNLGLTEASVEGMARRTGNAHVAWDSRRRLVQMFSEVVKGVDAMAFETALSEAREAAGVALDSDLDEAALRALAERFLDIYASHTGERFPEDPRDQLRLAVQAVFESWNNERAVTYRRLNGIPDDLGTAVTVQRMVFGNLGPELRSRGGVHPGPERRKPCGRTATSSSTRRGRTWWRGSATPRTSTAWRGGCPRSTPSCSRACAGWSATTATSRTSSTRSRRGGSSSSRREAPSGTPSPRSDLPPMPSPRGFWTVRRRCEGSTRTRSERSCTPRSIRRTAPKS